MYLERIAVSEFASRLSNTDIHSFEGVLYLLQEYEVGIVVSLQSITELRRKEIGSLTDENVHHDEYEFIYGEENVWYGL